MTRDELIEKMARAHYAKYFEVVADMEPAFHDQPGSHQDRMREAMEAALTAIEAAGLCIVPVEPLKSVLKTAKKNSDLVSIEFNCSKDDDAQADAEIKAIEDMLELINAGKL